MGTEPPRRRWSRCCRPWSRRRRRRPRLRRSGAPRRRLISRRRRPRASPGPRRSAARSRRSTPPSAHLSGSSPVSGISLPHPPLLLLCALCPQHWLTPTQERAAEEGGGGSQGGGRGAAGVQAPGEARGKGSAAPEAQRRPRVGEGRAAQRASERRAAERADGSDGGMAVRRKCPFFGAILG